MIIQQMVGIRGGFDEPNGHGLCRQAPKGLLAQLQHLAIKIGGGGKFLIGIGNFFSITEVQAEGDSVRPVVCSIKARYSRCDSGLRMNSGPKAAAPAVNAPKR